MEAPLGDTKQVDEDHVLEMDAEIIAGRVGPFKAASGEATWTKVG